MIRYINFIWNAFKIDRMRSKIQFQKNLSVCELQIDCDNTIKRNRCKAPLIDAPKSQKLVIMIHSSQRTAQNSMQHSSNNALERQWNVIF